MNKKVGVMVAALLALPVREAVARGVTPYLPLNLDPQVEAEVERVLILGGKPVMTRPIPTATVLDALPKACEADAVLCERVRKVLKNYMHNSGIEFVSLEASDSQGHADPVMPNQHGRTEDSHYQLAAAAYVQPNSYMLLNVGGVAYQGKSTATGSVLSLGFDWAQLDLGYRDHWWSPMTDSAMLISTEAPTMPSATLSNYRPLTRLGLQYELFLAQMSRSNRIELPNGTFTSGNPKMAGLHLGIEPASGWSLTASRVLIFGGGAAGGQSIGNIFDAFFNPSKSQSTGFGTTGAVGKQEASIASRFIFPGTIPFSVYFEYAANDTSLGKNYLFGKPDLSAGISFPHLGPFDLTVEHSNWEVTWYLHGPTTTQPGYLDGITNFGRVIGNWFGDQRQFGDTPGGQTNMLKLGWEPDFGGRFEAQFRMLRNFSYSLVPYFHEYMTSLSYSRPWRDYAIGAEVDAGRDVFGEHYTRLAAFMRYGDALGSSGGSGAFTASRADGSEMFVDLGANANQVNVDVTALTPRYDTRVAVAPHLGLGARRAVSKHQDLGVRVEVDDINGHTLIGARLLDYRYRFNGPLALGVFAGAAQYEIGTPAYGWWLGAGAQWRDVLPRWDLGLDYRYGAKLARQRTLPSDPQVGYRPDAFYNVNSITLYVSRKF
jgi:Capsule assembly protein Wzi